MSKQVDQCLLYNVKGWVVKSLVWGVSLQCGSTALFSSPMVYLKSCELANVQGCAFKLLLSSWVTDIQCMKCKSDLLNIPKLG